jgi:hypothetical protein
VAPELARDSRTPLFRQLWKLKEPILEIREQILNFLHAI